MMFDDVKKISLVIFSKQKARVSLARAAYSEADVLLLDDPLSAVDARVSKHLFENCINGANIMKEKTRILVTHQLQFLPFADKIVILNNGKIENEGTYGELVEKGVNFVQFVSHSEEKDDEVDEGLAEDETTAEYESLSNGKTQSPSSIRNHRPRRRRNTSSKIQWDSVCMNISIL